METYKEMKARQEKELNEFEGIFFAFSNKQFDEGMEKVGLGKDETKKIYSLGAGGYILKEKSKMFDNMLERHAEENKRYREENKTIDIKFFGVDSWNRATFRSIEKPYRFYGAVNVLFSQDDTEEKILNTIDEDCLCYFGNSFGCEPMGTDSGNIKIVKKGVKCTVNR